MKHKFELWIENNVYRASEKRVLSEAVLCYKVGANHAALLLSYMAFIEIIKNRILEAKRIPNNVSEDEWNRKKKEILNYDASDKTVYDMLQTQHRYFKITDSLRTQIHYWRDRRNECAHFKGITISEGLVESFWSFIVENINKITLTGSDLDLLNRLKLHYDENHTPINCDITPLALEIAVSVELTEFNDFLVAYDVIIKSAYDDNPILIMGESPKFYMIILSRLSDVYAEIAKHHIVQNNELIEEMFFWTPEFLSYFVDTPQFVRETWKGNLKKGTRWKSAIALMRNGIIPSSEYHEFVDDCIWYSKDSIPSDNEYNFLINTRFLEKMYDIFQAHLTKEHAYDWWVEENGKFIDTYLKRSLENKNVKLVELILSNIRNGVRTNTDIVYSSFLELIKNKREYFIFALECADAIALDIDLYKLIQ